MILPDFHLPTEIYIRQNIIDEISDICIKYGKRAIIVITEKDMATYHDAVENTSNLLKSAGLGAIIYDQLPEDPNTEEIDQAVIYAKKTSCDLVIGFGGINSLNASKAIALLTNNFLFSHDLFNDPQNIQKPVNLLTIPTHPVFGLEITPIVFINDIHDKVQKSYHNTLLYPVACIVDPSISLKQPVDDTMKSCISTLAVATESIISKRNNDIINTYALKSIDFIFRNISLVYREPDNVTPRRFLSAASVMSGIAFSLNYLSITLAISLSLSSLSDIDIYSSMCIILPHIMEFNLTSSPGKYVQMSKVMGEDVKDITVIEAAIKAVEAIRKLETDINIPQRLSQYNVDKSMLKKAAALTLTHGFIQNAPRDLDASEVETILIAAY